MLVPAAKKGEGNDYLTIRITDGNQSKEIQLEGGVSKIGAPAFFQFNGLKNFHPAQTPAKGDVFFGDASPQVVAMPQS